MRIELSEACSLLRQQEDILILSHQNPDGDTLGSALALAFTLRKLGKRASVFCADGFPERFEFMYCGEKPKIPEGKPFVVAVDVADPILMGKKLSYYYDKTDLCIDHHSSNTLFAANTLLESDAAATAEIMVKVIDYLGAGVDRAVAACLYTGIATDTGCFRYSNTTPQSHRFAARLMECGIDFSEINRQMFEIKSTNRIAVEQHILNSVKYFYDGKCAVMYITKELLKETGSTEEELESVSAMPYQIKGVKIGVTLRERDRGYKVSMRTSRQISAADICKRFGGGGHLRAAGCFIGGTLDEVIEQIEQAAGDALKASEDKNSAQCTIHHS